MKPIEVVNSIDPDALAADAAYGKTGARQLRVINLTDSPEHEGKLYMDCRDVEWMLSEYHVLIWKYKIRAFWAQVAQVAMADKLMEYSGENPRVFEEDLQGDTEGDWI